MRKILLVLIITLLSCNLYAQKKGYKEIQIGSTLDSIQALHKYKISPDTQKNSWIITGDSLRIFLTDADHLEIGVDDNHIIKRIDLFTKYKNYDNYDDWLSGLKYIINVINSDVGKLNSDDVSRTSSKDMWIAWSFTDTKTALILDVPKVDKFTTDFKGSYSLTWIEDPHNFADQKF
jgi:hypothetical protein